MQAISLKEPGHFESIEVQEPSSADLKTDEVLVKVCHVGLCGTDIHAYRGKQPFFEYPRILGHELGVEVLETGAEVSNLQVGDRCSVEPYLSQPGDRAWARGKTNCSESTRCMGVHVDGGMREKLILPARLLHRSHLPTRSLALVETLCIGHHAVQRACFSGDEIVCVVGMGPIGLGVLQFARLTGARVVAAEISADRLQTAVSMYPGLETIRIEPESGVEAAWEKTGLEPPEIMLDCTGNKESMEASINLAGHGGRVVMVGLFKGNLCFPDPEFHRKELTISATRNATASDFKSVISLMESDDVRVDPWITHSCQAKDFPEVIASWLAADSGLLKGIIEFS